MFAVCDMGAPNDISDLASATKISNFRLYLKITVNYSVFERFGNLTVTLFGFRHIFLPVGMVVTVDLGQHIERHPERLRGFPRILALLHHVGSARMP